ncbi:uncharacterized protein N7496_011522 [Penicillium cataractarum]|uniref:Uncharacterized protein n=1 Tax=Penicillium cataractarum TaxID=2100454 RepID=A0A9W9UWE3_9EURO|nr:uncharacterized protein N7496_011522 [Penicillium cataractarum]KAJ5359109.1 hypothetical protein N7496_011522 [Penicillium cataractarum]
MGIPEDKTEMTGGANVMEIEDCKPSMAELPVSGTVKLFEEEMVVLIPTPTPDPKDPLNLPTWRKYFIILLVGLYSAISVLGTSGLGSIRNEVEKMYPNDHIARRDFFSIAASQSAALATLMVQEIHFMHDHGSKIAYFVGVQCVGTTYGFMTIVNGVVFILSIFFVAETRYDRPRGHDTLGIDGQVEELKIDKKEEPFLNHATYGPRTWRDELRIFHFKPIWKDSVLFYKDTFKGLLLPTIFWLLLLNGACLGIYVYQASTFSTVLMSPPYSFHVDWLGFVQVTQVIDTMVMIPVLGYGSDFICKVLSKWRGGIFQPEYRLITIFIPASAAIISCTIYGRAATNPDQ